MTIISDSIFADFLSKSPLYNKLKAVENFETGENNYSNHLDFQNKPFKFKCPSEKETQTFRTKLWGQSMYFARRTYNAEEQDQLPVFFNELTGKLDLTIFIQGICQSCGHTIDFLIKSTSDKPWDQRKTGITIYIQKIGQFPGYEIEPDSIIQKYLSEEDVSNYKKALTCLSVNFGIGAYAYFRRIIENEIKRIIKDISELEFEGDHKVKQAYNQFEIDHQMSKLIDVINEFLPKSLKELGDNPIRLLYEQLSEGMHELSETICVEKSRLIDILLNYVIKKVNEEKYQLKDVKSAMLKLRTNSKN